MSNEEEYVPFGEEWEAEIMKLPKKYIVGLFRESAMKVESLYDPIESKTAFNYHRLDVGAVKEALGGRKFNYVKHITKAWKTENEEYFILFEEINGIQHWRISRGDERPIHDFMALWQIKNDLIGKGVVCVEVYPKGVDFKDGSNTYHLWTWKDIDVPNLATFYDPVGGYDK